MLSHCDGAMTSVLPFPLLWHCGRVYHQSVLHVCSRQLCLFGGFRHLWTFEDGRRELTFNGS